MKVGVPLGGMREEKFCDMVCRVTSQWLKGLLWTFIYILTAVGVGCYLYFAGLGIFLIGRVIWGCLIDGISLWSRIFGITG